MQVQDVLRVGSENDPLIQRVTKWLQHAIAEKQREVKDMAKMAQRR